MAATTSTYIYGAGRMGREVLAHCRGEGIEPAAFIDRQASRIPVVDGIPVISPDCPPADRARGEVIIALHSHGVDVAQVKTALELQAYASVRTLWTECARSAWLPQLPYWLDPQVRLEEHSEAIARSRALLADAASLRVFDEQLALRAHGDYAGLGHPTPEDQYVPHDLPRWRQPMRLIDCGAYDGDTIRLFRRRDYTLEQFACLEPDPDNFRKLDEGLGSDPAGRLIMAGAAAVDGEVAFDAGDGTSARLNAAGGAMIKVVPLDAICADLHPTLIKMDIEGAERDALVGTSGILARDRPDLAISVYHRVDDLWRIALLIDDLVEGYRFHLRSHAYNGFETVLYAMAHP